MTKKQKTTIRDIARLAGVSETTVSLSFQQNSRISEQTRAKVLQIARQINYVPNAAARDLRAGRTRTIGFLINDITNPFYGSMIRTSEQVASERGYEVIFAESQWSPQRAVTVLGKMIQSRIEGVILCFSEKSEDAYQMVRQSNLPHVAVDTVPSFYTDSYILNDGQNTGYLAASHLVDCTCRSPVIVNARRDLGSFSSITQMEAGFEQFMSAQDIGYRSIDAGLSIESGIRAFRDLSDSNTAFDGVFCMNDLCAMGFMHASREQGLYAGRDYAIMGVDNNDVSSLGMIGLTSVYIDYDDIAKEAADFVIDSIEGRSSALLQRIVRPKLVARESSLGFKQGR